MSGFALPKRTLVYDHVGGGMHIEATFATSSGVASMLRTRLGAEAFSQEQEGEKNKHPVSWEQFMMRSWFYPDFAAACTRLFVSGFDEEEQPLEYRLPEGEVLPYEVYNSLPEMFLVKAETAIYELNPNWVRQTKEEETAEDPKGKNSATESTKGSTDK